jgi:hypothetical protein
VFLDHDGGLEESPLRLDQLLERADVIFYPVDCVSHEATLHVKAHCQRAYKPSAPAPEVPGIIAQHTPDIAFVDIKLRERELAYDLIDFLHERGIRVIIVSGYAVVPLVSQLVVYETVCGRRAVWLTGHQIARRL